MPRGKRVEGDHLARLRDLAEQGLTAMQAAERTGLNYQTILRIARHNDFTFRHGSMIGATPGPKPIKSVPPRPPRHDFASPELRREIEAAKREMATAPLFKDRYG